MFEYSNIRTFSDSKKMTDNDRARAIRREIIAAGSDLKAKHTWLRHQNAIGLTILLTATACVLAAAVGYWFAVLPAWAVIIWSAFWMGVLHELEHDLIHWLDCKKNKAVHNAMLLTVWLLRPTTINPWLRRHYHFEHHQHSGTEIDIEERSVTNGQRWSLLRLFITADLVLIFLFRARSMRRDLRQKFRNGSYSTDAMATLKRITLLGMLPFGVAVHLVWYAFVATHLTLQISAWIGFEIPLPAWWLAQMQWIDYVTVVLIAPNILRQFCLHFITSNLHYYGDVEDGNLMQQTQVLNVWWTLPFQIFCFNFGSSHAIHHFVVQEPFYIRQLTVPRAHRIMREMGVRFNDIGTFGRANRFNGA
jgi:hypothetical protein